MVSWVEKMKESQNYFNLLAVKIDLASEKPRQKNPQKTTKQQQQQQKNQYLSPCLFPASLK